MNESLNTTAMRMLLQLREEDGAGTSQDGVATNSAGGGNIAGLPPDSPPGPDGTTHRRRKRNALKTRADRKLYKALTAEGHVEFDLDHYKTEAVELNRYADEIDEGARTNSPKKSMVKLHAMRTGRSRASMPRLTSRHRLLCSSIRCLHAQTQIDGCGWPLKFGDELGSSFIGPGS